MQLYRLCARLSRARAKFISRRPSLRSILQCVTHQRHNFLLAFLIRGIWVSAWFFPFFFSLFYSTSAVYIYIYLLCREIKKKIARASLWRDVCIFYLCNREKDCVARVFIEKREDEWAMRSYVYAAELAQCGWWLLGRYVAHFLSRDWVHGLSLMTYYGEYIAVYDYIESEAFEKRSGF